MLALIAAAILSGRDTLVILKKKKARKLLEQVQIGESFDTVRSVRGTKYKLITETADVSVNELTEKHNHAIITDKHTMLMYFGER